VTHEPYGFKVWIQKNEFYLHCLLFYFYDSLFMFCFLKFSIDVRTSCLNPVNSEYSKN
jgi:hypothetical protein